MFSFDSRFYFFLSPKSVAFELLKVLIRFSLEARYIIIINKIIITTDTIILLILIVLFDGLPTSFGKDNVTLESTINIYGHLYDENEYGKTYIDISNEDRKNNVPDTKYDLLGSYKCTNKDCTLLNQYSYDLSTVWIKDDKFVVYNFKTQKAKNVNLSEKY